MDTLDWSNLSARQRERLRLYVEEGLTYQQIADKEGLTQQAIGLGLRPILTEELRAQHSQANRRLQVDSLQALRPALLDLMQQGSGSPEICRQLNLNRYQLKKLLGSVNVLTRRRWVGRLQKNWPRAFTAENRVAALQEAARLNGGRIGIARYRRLRKSHPAWPSAESYQRDGWNYWVTLAGLPTNAQPAELGRQIFSEADFRDAAMYVYHKLGHRFYSGREYDKYRRPTDPSAVTIRLRYGRWVASLEHLLAGVLK